MTGEEMERAISFIIEQQAQFASNQQLHKEALLKHEETMRRIEGVQEQTALQVQQTALQVQQTTLQIQHLSGAMVELAEAHTRTENTLAETNEKLNALINTVERHVSEGRNGKT